MVYLMSSNIMAFSEGVNLMCLPVLWHSVQVCCNKKIHERTYLGRGTRYGERCEGDD